MPRKLKDPSLKPTPLSRAEVKSMLAIAMEYPDAPYIMEMAKSEKKGKTTEFFFRLKGRNGEPISHQENRKRLEGAQLTVAKILRFGQLHAKYVPSSVAERDSLLKMKDTTAYAKMLLTT